jgi:hypothetical protein
MRCSKQPSSPARPLTNMQQVFRRHAVHRNMLAYAEHLSYGKLPRIGMAVK